MSQRVPVGPPHERHRGRLGAGLHDAALAVFILASVLTDWNYAIQLLSGRNHRTFLTHSPPVYLAVTATIMLILRAA